jgi:S-methylmethionine-dependent homocysteine/selenocysteine methylase
MTATTHAAPGPFDRGRTFLTFGGPETHLLFEQGFPLRDFCAFEIFDHPEALAKLERELLRPAFDAACQHGLGLLVDCFVWRASPDYMSRLGYGAADVARVNRQAVERMRRLSADWRTGPDGRRAEVPVLIAADVGPRGDGYSTDGSPRNVAEGIRYHEPQVRALAEAGADVLFAYTMTNIEESVSLALLAREHRLPIVVSPTVEVDGALPDGSSLQDLVECVDAATDGYPELYMVNCAHPTHLAPALRAGHGQAWLGRFGGLRANASRRSHAELDQSTTLDAGDARDLAERMAVLRESHDLRVVGGCCGTSAEHIQRIAAACVTRAPAVARRPSTAHPGPAAP